MNDRAAVCLGAAVGAIVGGALGFLYLTRRGRRMRDELEPAVTNLVGELQKAWVSAEEARASVHAWTTRTGDDETAPHAGHV